MSALITSIIQPRAYEQIRDKMAQILLEEFQNQYDLTDDEQLNLKKVYIERYIPFDHTELPCLNIGIERGDYSNQHQGQFDGDYRFYVECMMKSAFKGSQRGDTLSRVWVHKVMGVAMAILENPVYKTLGFAPGTIKHRHVESFVFAEPTKMDEEMNTMSRMAVVVKAVETVSMPNPPLIAQNYTTVKLFDSDKGYYWQIESE